ncbi:helix-turn-helix transcriptional regulator [Burkholderia multivorans]|uniref:helix-turn-helix transcriptional regulator n=1 Tax=Burkholderia multivorans TaxID=87883 RepID=UPI0037097198
MLSAQSKAGKGKRTFGNIARVLTHSADGHIRVVAASVDPSRPPLPAPESLPLDGYSRWKDLKPFLPFSQETLRQRELANRFPKRVQLGSARCVGWPNRELHRWFADPANYRAMG